MTRTEQAHSKATIKQNKETENIDAYAVFTMSLNQLLAEMKDFEKVAGIYLKQTSVYENQEKPDIKREIL
ncbi:MAG: hypothetical protein FWG77_05415 [Treponema sp.]|nr:hypothetical protein [Treponema sp.]